MMIAFRTIVSRDSDRRWDAEVGERNAVQRIRVVRRVLRVREPDVQKPVAPPAPWIEDQYEEAERWDGLS